MASNERKALHVESSKSGGPQPLDFVRVAAKGLSNCVSLLFATLAERSISVAAKGLMGADCWRESNCLGWEDFGGVRRTSWRADIKDEAPTMAGADATRQV